MVASLAVKLTWIVSIYFTCAWYQTRNPYHSHGKRGLHMAAENSDKNGLHGRSSKKRNSAEFLQIVNARTEMDNPISSKDNSQIQSLLAINIRNMDKNALLTAVSGLGSINSKASLPRNRASNEILLKRLQQIKPIFSTEEVARLIVGMARLKFSWGEVSQVQGLVMSMDSSLPSTNQAQLGDILWGLGMMGVRWLDITDRTRALIIASLHRNANKFTPFSLSSVWWALAKMGAPQGSGGGGMPTELTTKLVHQLDQVKLKLSPQQASKALWALGGIGVRFRDLPEGLVECLVRKVGEIKKSKMGQALSASHALIGVAKLGVHWNNHLSPTSEIDSGVTALSSGEGGMAERRVGCEGGRTAAPRGISGISASLKGVMWEQFVRVCQSRNSIGVASAIWAMGTMGAGRAVQSQEVQQLVISSAELVMVDCDARSFSSIMW